MNGVVVITMTRIYLFIFLFLCYLQVEWQEIKMRFKRGLYPLQNFETLWIKKINGNFLIVF